MDGKDYTVFLLLTSVAYLPRRSTFLQRQKYVHTTLNKTPLRLLHDRSVLYRSLIRLQQVLMESISHPAIQYTYFTEFSQGWSGGAMVLCKLPVPGRPSSMDYGRARAYCACSRCGRGLIGHFFSRLSFLYSHSLSLGDGPVCSKFSWSTYHIQQFRIHPSLNFLRGGRVVRWCCVSFQCRGVLLIWIMVGQGPIALAVGAGGGC